MVQSRSNMNAQHTKKFRFLPGLAGLFVGFVVWFLLSVVFGVSQAVTSKSGGHFWLAISFAVMVLSPLWYWILRIPYVAGKEKNKKWLKILPVVTWWVVLALILLAGLSNR